MFFAIIQFEKFFLKENKFFTFILEEGVPSIIDYCLLDRDIVISTNGSLEYDKKKEKEAINTINGLQKALEELVKNASEVLRDNSLHFCRNTPHYNDEASVSQVEKYFDLTSEDIKHLVNQLIIDILYDNYRVETEMTLYEYCVKYMHVLYMGEWKTLSNIEDAQNKGCKTDKYSITKQDMYTMMDRRLKTYIRMMETPVYTEEHARRFIFHDLYSEYIAEKSIKKPKWVWDLIYYNDTLAAFKQYRRDCRGNTDEDYIMDIEELRLKHPAPKLP